MNSGVVNSTNSPAVDYFHKINTILQVLWDLRIGHESTLSSSLFPVFLSIGYYLIAVFPLTFLDLYGGTNWKWYAQFKLQTTTPTTWPMVRRALVHVSVNNLLYILPVTIAQYIWVPATPLPETAPTLCEVFAQLGVLLVIFDFQYGVWHAVHHKNRWLYRTFHSVHHQYHTTFALVGQYLHPWELFTIAFMTTVDPWAFNCHPLTIWLWMLLNIWLSTEAHSGLDFPLFSDKLVPFGILGGSRKHDMHHMKPLTNFQPYLSTWDRIFDWDCPGMRAGGVKPPELLAWENRNRKSRMAKHAAQLMSGQINGFLVPTEDDDKIQ